MKGLLLSTIIKMDVKAARHRNNEFLVFLVGVSATVLTTWYIVYPVGTFYLKGDIL